MAKYVGYKRPKDTKKTMKHFLTYLGHYKWAFFLVAILVFIRSEERRVGKECRSRWSPYH